MMGKIRIKLHVTCTWIILIITWTIDIRVKVFCVLKELFSRSQQSFNLYTFYTPDGSVSIRISLSSILLAEMTIA